MKLTGSDLLSAVTVLLMASSCVKEVVSSDQNSSGGIVFTAYSEGLTVTGTKTVLNKSLMPEWVDGDAIGVTTETDVNVECRLVSAAEGTFSRNGIAGDAPFRAVYPYEENNTFDGMVLRAEIPQIQTVETGQHVAQGALVAACISETPELSFRNCVSLMQIDIPRNDVRQVKVEATGENEYLTGKFTMDMAAETLTPIAVEGDGSLSGSVTLVAADEALTAGTYYVAVLPVPISGVRITFTNTSDESIEVYKDSSTILERSGGVSLGKFFTYDISTPDDLLRWSKSSAKFTKWDVVSINSDIDMSEVASDYVETVDFKGVFNGNGNTVSGLTTPLFANLYGSVNNLILDSEIIYKGKTNRMPGHLQAVGVLAHIAYTDENPEAVISNVTVKGSLTIDRTNDYSNYFCAGGLLGSSNGVTLKNCSNHASVNVSSITLTGSSSRLIAGGVVGQVAKSAAVMENCDNYADVTVSDGCNTSAQSIVGGVAGYVTVDSSFSLCDNEGKVTNSAAGTSGCFTGGIAGSIGTRSDTNGSSDIPFAGSFMKCSNKGAVSDGSSGSAAVSHWVAGGVAYANLGGITLSECENSGTVSLSVTSCDVTSIGGVFGHLYQTAASTIQGCDNTGDISVDDTGCATIYEGGVVAFTNKNAVNILKCTNRGRVSNYGTASLSVRAGGIIGFAGAGASIGTGADDFCSNYGSLNSYSAQSAHTAIGGIVGQSASKAITICGACNYGDISFTTTEPIEELYLGGIGGVLGTTPTVDRCISNCVIAVYGSVESLCGSAVMACSKSGATVIKNCRVAGQVSDTVIDADNFSEYLCALYTSTNPKKTLENNSYLLDSSGGNSVDASLCVGTYNILSSTSASREPYNTWDAAKGTIASIIAKMNNDIMTVNEIGTTEMDYLTSRLPHMGIVEFPNHNGGYSTASGILYNTSRLTLLDEGIFWLSNPETSQIITEQGAYSYVDWDSFPYKEYKASSGRSCVWGKFQDNKTLRTFYYFAAHPHHRGDDSDSKYFVTEKSLNSGTIRSLLKQVAYINTEALPYIVAGDMNTNSQYISYGFFTDSGLTSSFDAANDAGTLDAQTASAPATCPGTTPGSYKKTEAYRLDHIWHAGFVTRSYANVFTKYRNSGDGNDYFPSDHLPVWIVLEYD